jgi:hypothetical protein
MKDEASSFILHLILVKNESQIKNLLVFIQIAHGAKGLQFFFVRVLFLELWFIAGFVGDNI